MGKSREGELLVHRVYLSARSRGKEVSARPVL